jgi:hypothetical protein
MAQRLKLDDPAYSGAFHIALDHLTRGRAALYAAILESRGRRRGSAQASSLPAPSEESQRGLTFAAEELDSAVSGLRDAGVQRTFRAVSSPAPGCAVSPARAPAQTSAQSDLDEAWEIAERGPMPLFQADIHLYRARLFFRENPYPWQSPQDDLAEARRLIFKHGYLRRKEELEDAEAAWSISETRSRHEPATARASSSATGATRTENRRRCSASM